MWATLCQHLLPVANMHIMGLLNKAMFGYQLTPRVRCNSLDVFCIAPLFFTSSTYRNFLWWTQLLTTSILLPNHSFTTGFNHWLTTSKRLHVRLMFAHVPHSGECCVPLTTWKWRYFRQKIHLILIKLLRQKSLIPKYLLHAENWGLVREILSSHKNQDNI